MEDNRLDRAWKVGGLILSGPCVLVLVAVTSMNLNLRHATYLIPCVAITLIFLACFIWIKNILSMNLFRRNMICTPRKIALLLYVMTSLCWLSASFAILQNNGVLQFVGSIVGETVSWFAFITIFNSDFHPPSRQQLLALLQYLTSERCGN